MALNVELGKTIRLPADFSSGDEACDPLTPRVSISGPDGEPVAENLTPHRVDEGVYYLDYLVAGDAPPGTWTANWTGTINGELVGGEDRFEVLPATAPASVAEPAPAKEPKAAVAEEADDVSPGKLWAKSGEGKGKPKAKRGLIAGIVVILIAGGFFYSQRSRNASIQGSFEAGDSAFKEGNFDAAQEQYFDVLEKDPNNKFALFNLGMLAQRGNRISEAQHYYDRSLEVDPDFLPALYNKAFVMESLNRSTEAADLYRQLLAANPTHSASHFNLGLLLFAKLEQPEEGKKEMREALRLDPELESKLDPRLVAELNPPSPAPSPETPPAP